MRRPVLLLTSVLLFVGQTYAFNGYDGAIGIGVTTQSDENSVVSRNLKLNLFFDMGGELLGPVHYGFELAGDLTRLDQSSGVISEKDVRDLNLGGGNWSLAPTGTTFGESYSLWDIDLGPRVYLSFDNDGILQILGFAGLNFNLQNLDYTVKNTGDTAFEAATGSLILNPGDSHTTSTGFNGSLQAVGGLRVTVAMVYLEGSRYLNLTNGTLSMNNDNLIRFGAGLNFRF